MILEEIAEHLRVDYIVTGRVASKLRIPSQEYLRLRWEAFVGYNGPIRYERHQHYIIIHVGYGPIEVRPLNV